MESPLISILIPTYEPNPSHLKAALDSLCMQTETRWKAFLHDDCSHTNVAEIVAPYLHDERIHFRRSPARLGIGGNWNACLQEATAPYVQFLFQDDTWHPEYLRRAMKPLEQDASIGFVSVEHSYDCEEGMETAQAYQELKEFKAKNVKPEFHTGADILHWWIQRGLHPNIVGEPSFVMLRKSLVDAVGSFHEHMPQYIDVEYWIRCLEQGNWYYEPKESGTFRVHAEGASARNFESGAGLYDRLECFQQLIARTSNTALKKGTIRARNSALKVMSQKFMDRRKLKKSVGKGGGLKAFVLRHPLLALRAGWYTVIR